MEDLKFAEISKTASLLDYALLFALEVGTGDPVPQFCDTLVNPLVSSTKAIRQPKPLVVVASTMAICRPKLFVPLCGILLATILSNQGESLGSGGRTREGRNGGGGNGNQGIGGGVGGGGGQREGIGNERRGNRGRNHGGGNGNRDDDGNDRGGQVGYIEGERGPVGPRLHRLAKMLLFLNAQMIGTLESLDIHGLPARAKIFRVVSLGFNSVALVCLSASIGQRRTSPRLASILSWIGSFATLLGFISMIAMAFSASFIP